MFRQGQVLAGAVEAHRRQMGLQGEGVSAFLVGRRAFTARRSAGGDRVARERQRADAELVAVAAVAFDADPLRHQVTYGAATPSRLT